MSSCLYSTIFINRGTRRTLCVHEKNDDDDDFLSLHFFAFPGGGWWQNILTGTL